MYEKIKGIRYRFLNKKYGAIEERDTVGAIHKLEHDHGIDITDAGDLADIELFEPIFSRVELPEGTETQAIVVVTTPAQLLNAAKASLCGWNFGIHADGTHGMVLGEAQIVFIGTHDIHQRGHRIAALILPKAGCNAALLTSVFQHLKSMVEAMAMARLPRCPDGWKWVGFFSMHPSSS